MYPRTQKITCLALVLRKPQAILCHKENLGIKSKAWSPRSRECNREKREKELYGLCPYLEQTLLMEAGQGFCSNASKEGKG